MVTADPESYFRASRSALNRIFASPSVTQQDPRSTRTILDLGSGYGRAYRAFAAAFPDAKPTACARDARAARFCADTLGSDRVQSSEALQGIQLIGFDFLPRNTATLQFDDERGMEITEDEYRSSIATKERMRRVVARFPEWELVGYVAGNRDDNHDAVTPWRL